MVLYSAQDHRHKWTLHALEQFGALYMHNHDDKYPARPGFEPDTSMLQTPVDTNQPTTGGVLFKCEAVIINIYIHVSL